MGGDLRLWAYLGLFMKALPPRVLLRYCDSLLASLLLQLLLLALLAPCAASDYATLALLLLLLLSVWLAAFALLAALDVAAS